jgi:hypothetical protein
MDAKSISKNPIDPKVKDVLLILATGTFITATILMPGLVLAVKPFIASNKNRGENEWNKFNKARLRQILNRLHKQKMVEIIDINGEQIVKLSEKGHTKLLRYNLNQIHLNNQKWDGKWRIIIYDIFSGKKEERYIFHKILKKLKFLQLQKSVYLSPYPCKDEIEYIRQICGIGKEVLILIVTGIENEKVYKEYFGLK